jgi:hypothetical protein
VTAIARHPLRCRKRLAVALHEAGHVVVCLAIAARVQAATAKPDAGNVRLDPRDHAAAPPSPPSRGIRLASALANGAIYFGGSIACRLRLRSRWHGIGHEAARLSAEDLEGAIEAIDELVACGIPLAVACEAIHRFTQAILMHHARPLARLTVALARRGEISGDEIRAIVPEVQACGETFRLLGETVGDLLERYPPPPEHDIEAADVIRAGARR